MKVTIFEDHESASVALAEKLASFASSVPNAKIALPTGSTPLRTYAILAEQAKAQKSPLSGATIYALDEYLGLAPDHTDSFAHYMRSNVIEPLQLPASSLRHLNGAAEDAAAEANRYESQLVHDRLDLVVLGMGPNGHVAFNEPEAQLYVATHIGYVAPPGDKVKPQCITIGLGTIMRAPEVWLIATGTGKADAVQHMLGGRLDTLWPASLLQLHPNLEVFVDKAAAAKL
eukprot:TRINITY_DN12835_c0_g1_i1.p1 TRINITY_DN12835_c0_g1~~TRINITY_DN12835_c0_g1_i1.p1  ORF type:complete len:230 (-),score=50.16 TRINITY_DN12835_c0_g1_i1:74-763(-)